MQQIQTPRSISLRRKQQGFTLIELVIVLAIAAVILFGVFILVSRAQTSRVANDEVQNFNMMIADVRTKFGPQGSFVGITPAVLIDLGIVPKHMINAATIRTGWSTTVAVAPTNLNGTVGDAVRFSYTVPRASCGDFATGASGAAGRVTVDGVVVKDVPAALNNVNVAALAGACDSDIGGTVDILLDQGR